MSRRHSLPAEVFALVEHSPASVLLDRSTSTESGSEPNSTQLFVDPVRICAAFTPAQVTDLFSEIENAVAAGRTAAGYFTYECGNSFEPKAGLRSLPDGQPLAWFGIYECGYSFDHEKGTFADGEPAQLAGLRSELLQRSEDPCIESEFSLTQEQYAERVEAIHELICSGDVYQLNFTMPCRLNVRGGLGLLYQQLRERQPVEYGAFIHAQPGHHILSFSPELFFCLDHADGERRITTRPMKGTVARGRTTAEDRAHSEWLRNDAKNRAENVMIVDLLRNDLGRMAKFGTVRTEQMFAVERHPTLWQMTSTIRADLRPEVGFTDIFRALFPCGSITGAPKIRAMQLLADLEEQPRGVYTGAIGYFSPQRTVFNVAIRTLEMHGNQGTMGVGSGIVIDSVAEEEYSECQLKAQFLTSARDVSLPWVTHSNKFLLIETLLWDRRFPLIELHLDRLADSAEYFGFSCNREQVKSALDEHAKTFSEGAPRKVRLLLDEDGEPTIGREAIEPVNPSSPVLVRIAANRANSADRWLYHKTTRRALYSMSRLQDHHKDCDELLFLNERDELTEGSISNIFIEKAGSLFTPPVECGLLGGVYRRHLLETRPNAEERVLKLDDLRNADAVYTCNAVRGLRKAQMIW